jgi:hypothetical protein
MVMNALRHIISSMTSLHSLQRKLVYMWFMINYTLFDLPCFIHLDAMLTLSLPRWGSNPCRHCYCWFHMCISFGMCISYTWFCSIRGSPKNKDCHLGDGLLPLAIKAFAYLHMQVDDFLQLCANKMWGMEGLKSLALVLITCFWQRVSIVLQKM